MRFGFFVSAFTDFTKFISWIVRIQYEHVRFYQFHQIPLLWDHHCHQELACTLKDPPRRVDRNEPNVFFVRNFDELSKNRLKTYSCGAVCKPHMRSYISLKWIIWIECMLGELWLGRLGEPLAKLGEPECLQWFASSLRYRVRTPLGKPSQGTINIYLIILLISY